MCSWSKPCCCSQGTLQKYAYACYSSQPTPSSYTKGPSYKPTLEVQHTTSLHKFRSLCQPHPLQTALHLPTFQTSVELSAAVQQAGVVLGCSALRPQVGCSSHHCLQHDLHRTTHQMHIEYKASAAKYMRVEVTSVDMDSFQWKCLCSHLWGLVPIIENMGFLCNCCSSQRAQGRVLWLSQPSKSNRSARVIPALGKDLIYTCLVCPTTVAPHLALLEIHILIPYCQRVHYSNHCVRHDLLVQDMPLLQVNE
jgi:hypothetical protein